jgi:hypothetical protein
MTASLADLLNFAGIAKTDPRANFIGEAKVIPMAANANGPGGETPTFVAGTPPEIDLLAPMAAHTAPADIEMWSEATMLELIGRLVKGSSFMAEHFYDERGEAQLDRFIEVMERSYLAVTAYRTKKILEA